MSDDKRKANGTFAEGNKFSRGQPRIPADLKEARKANAQDVERIVNTFLEWSVNDLAAYCKDPQNPVLECLIASILGVAIRQGDPVRLSFFLNFLGIAPKIKTNGDDEGDGNIHAKAVALIHKIEKKEG